MVKTFNLSNPGPQREAKGKRGRRRGKPKNALDGWIILDKPVGITSTQALGAVKRLFLPEKAGHAGTLDPLATGILPLAFGEATKTVPFVVDGAKTYRFTVRWGAATDTDDADGKVIETSPVRPSLADVEAALPSFVGDISQVPPRFSAVKVDGQRAYDLARDGEEVELKARVVTITQLTVVGEPEGDDIELEAHCGKGTYVRAIARDLAKQLGTAGHVTALRRTRVGPFSEDDSITLDALSALAKDPQAAIDTHLLNPTTALSGIATVDVDRVAASRLRQGQATIVRPLTEFEEDEIGAICGGELVALCRAQQGALHPVRVFRSPRRRITLNPQEPASPCAPSETPSPAPPGN
ncbi:MAG: tRNA pseudouridine(55) synthase TruB [Pseudomonadota bacterium]